MMMNASYPQHPELSPRDVLKRFIIQGIIRNDHVALFFSTIRAVGYRGHNSSFAVAMTESGITLLYNEDIITTLSKDEIRFALSHELMHVLNLHFMRSQEYADTYGIPLTQMQTGFMPYSDLPVNYSLREYSGFQSMQAKYGCLTYETLRLEPDKYPALESVYDYIRNNQDKMPQQTIQVVLIDEDGNLSNPDGTSYEQDDDGEDQSEENKINGNGRDGTIPGQGQSQGQNDKNNNGKTTVLIPKVSQEAMKEIAKEIKDRTDAVSKAIGSLPAEFKAAYDWFDDMYTGMAMTGWRLLEHYMVGYRSRSNVKKLSFRKLNRRTGMLPGKQYEKGFSVLFVVDESGSMADEEVITAFQLAKKSCLRETNDRVYIAHWDTDLFGEIEEVKHVHELKDISRKKVGGTMFGTMFSNKKILACDVDLIVVVTDGETNSWPDKRAPVPCVWVITGKSGLSYYNQYGKDIMVYVGM